MPAEPLSALGNAAEEFNILFLSLVSVTDGLKTSQPELDPKQDDKQTPHYIWAI